MYNAEQAYKDSQSPNGENLNKILHRIKQRASAGETKMILYESDNIPFNIQKLTDLGYTIKPELVFTYICWGKDGENA